MGSTCVGVVGWLWRLGINWEAWSAIGTVLAAAVALFLPRYGARKEWSRQDRLRVEDLARAEKEWARQDELRIAEQVRIEDAKNDVVHEVCSTVDRILAYRKSAITLFDADNVYIVGFAALDRIHENTKTLLEMLEMLKGRSELTDGALYVAVSGKRVAQAVIVQTENINNGMDPGWVGRIHALKAFDSLSAMIEARNAKVRNYAALKEKSEVAELILKKYKALAAAIKASRAADSGAPDVTIADEYY